MKAKRVRAKERSRGKKKSPRMRTFASESERERELAIRRNSPYLAGRDAAAPRPGGLYPRSLNCSHRYHDPIWPPTERQIHAALASPGTTTRSFVRARITIIPYATGLLGVTDVADARVPESDCERTAPEGYAEGALHAPATSLISDENENEFQSFSGGRPLPCSLLLVRAYFFSQSLLRSSLRSVTDPSAVLGFLVRRDRLFIEFIDAYRFSWRYMSIFITLSNQLQIFKSSSGYILCGARSTRHPAMQM